MTFTREQIIAWAREAKLLDSVTRAYWWPEIIRFAALIEQATIERCAKVCDEQAQKQTVGFKGELPYGSTPPSSPPEAGLWVSFNEGRTYFWNNGAWVEWISRRTLIG